MIITASRREGRALSDNYVTTGSSQSRLSDGDLALRPIGNPFRGDAELVAALSVSKVEHRM